MMGYGMSYAQMLSADLPDSKGIKIGESRARLHVGVKTTEMYDDNIYLSKDDKKEDWITIIEPMVALKAPLGDNLFTAEYKFSEYLYAKYDKESHPDHLAKGSLEINMTDYQLRFDEKYQRFTNRASMENSTRVRQQVNTARAGFSTIEYNKFGFDVGYTNKIEDYLSDQIIISNMKYKDKDRMSHIVDLQLLYKAAPKTTLIAQTDLGWIDYDSKLNPDSFYVEPLLGVRGEITNKVTAELRAGYRHQEYDKSELVRNKDFGSFVARGGVRFQPTKDDMISADIERSSYESTYKDINYYTGTAGILAYEHKFSDKLSMTPYGTYAYHQYPEDTTEDSTTKKRTDKLYGAGIALRYILQDWLAFETRYDYKEKDSNFKKFAYKDNTVSVSATIGF
jgi:polysaccharide biosynthesis protein VpsM